MSTDMIIYWSVFAGIIVLANIMIVAVEDFKNINFILFLQANLVFVIIAMTWPVIAIVAISMFPIFLIYLLLKGVSKLIRGTK